MVKFTKEHKSRLEKLATPTLANVLDDIGFEGIMYNLEPAGFGMRVVGCLLYTSPSPRDS